MGVHQPTQTVTAATYVFALMWIPGVATMLTCRIVGRPLSSLGLGRFNGKRRESSGPRGTNPSRPWSTATPTCRRGSGLSTFTFMAVAISFAQAWLRLRTDSVWPPIFLRPNDAVDLLPAHQ